jgi:hypothetical protein
MFYCLQMSSLEFGLMHHFGIMLLFCLCMWIVIGVGAITIK